MGGIIRVRNIANELPSNMFKIVITSCFLFQTISAYYFFPDLPVGVPDPDRDTSCSFDNDLFHGNLKNLSLWAYQMLDASGKAPTGVLNGNLFDFGNFEQCVNLVAPIKSKYCMVQISAENIPLPNPPRNPISLDYKPLESVLRKIYVNSDEAQQRRDKVQIGWCIPSSCHTDDLVKYLNNYIKSKAHVFHSKNVTFRADINEMFCQTKNEAHYGYLEVIFCILTAAILTTVISATAMDYRNRKNNNEQKNSYIKIFSAIISFNELSEANYNKGLAAFNGIKCLAFVPVFIAHLICISITLPLVNIDYVEALAKSIPSMLFLNCSLFIDAFFVISAFLLVYKLMDNNKSPAFWLATRYISLTPTLAYIIFFYVTMLKHVGHGPMWNAIIGAEVNDCVNNWWASLLYISNYVNSDHMCMLQTWYLDCDFHFFIMGLIIISVYKKSPLAAKIFGAVCLLGSIVVSFLYLYHYEIKLIHSLAVRLVSRIKTSPEFVMAYQTSHVRAGPYFIGLFGGFIYVHMKNNNQTFSKLKSNIIYTASIILLALPMFSGVIIYNPNITIDPFTNALYISTYRLLWAFGTIGLLLCIQFGDAYLLKNVLGFKPFVPLSKLVYGAYISHMILILRNFGLVHSAAYYDMLGMWVMLFGFLSASFMISLFLYIGIEAPVKHFYREITSPRNRAPKEQSHM